MKLPKLPWWGWTLLAVYAWGVVGTLSMGMVNALLWPLTRLKPKDTRPLGVAEGSTFVDPSALRTQTARDRYAAYLATTPLPPPPSVIQQGDTTKYAMTFAEWTLVETGDAKDSERAATLMS